jgi:hypothetical protein
MCLTNTILNHFLQYFAIILHFFLVNSDFESQNWHRFYSDTLYVPPHSPFHILKWMQLIKLIMTIIHHTAWLHGMWRCVRKDGYFLRMSHFWPICKVSGLSYLLLLTPFWRWFLASIVDQMDNWWLLQQFLVTNDRGKMLSWGNCRTVHIPK